MSERKKLLLADDSVTIQKVVNLTFADEGIDVVAVGDGDAAMEKFVEYSPDLVMVDVNMPGTDGYRICEMIKQDEETAHIPVILLVGSFEPFDEEEAYRVGADGYLTKPFQSIRQLVSKVSQMLDSSNASSFPALADDDEQIGFHAVNQSAPQNFQADDALIYAQSYSNDADDIVRFDDADADDETIQTDQIGSLPADETQRFSAAFSADDSSLISVAQPSGASPAYEIEEVDDWTNATSENRTATDSFSDRYNTAPLDREIYASAENERNFSSEDTKEDTEDESFTGGAIAASAPPRNFSWDFDDLDLLEVSYPNSGSNQEAKFETAVEPEIDESPSVAEPEPVGDAPEAQRTVANISPELIERIASRVAEKLSERVAAAVTREIVARMPELIAEELGRETGEK